MLDAGGAMLETSPKPCQGWLEAKPPLQRKWWSIKLSLELLIVSSTPTTETFTWSRELCAGGVDYDSQFTVMAQETLLPGHQYPVLVVIRSNTAPGNMTDTEGSCSN